MNSLDFRYGLFDGLFGAGSTAFNDVAPWHGYFAGNAAEAGAQGVFEAPADDQGAGQGAALSFDVGSQVLPASSSGATGTYDDADGMQVTPAGRYSFSMEVARIESGLTVSYSMVQVDAANLPTGAYAHAGTAIDTSPTSWTFDKLGLMLYGSAYTGTIIVDDIRVAATDVVPTPGDYNGNGSVDAGDYLVWRMSVGQTGSRLVADGFHDGVIDRRDYDVWRAHFGAVSGDLREGMPSGPAVPEPVSIVPALFAGIGLLVVRMREPR
jgi:hypothetical protein